MDLPRAALMSYGRLVPVRHSPAPVIVGRHIDTVVTRAHIAGARPGSAA